MSVNAEVMALSVRKDNEEEPFSSISAIFTCPDALVYQDLKQWGETANSRAPEIGDGRERVRRKLVMVQRPLLCIARTASSKTTGIL